MIGKINNQFEEVYPYFSVRCENCKTDVECKVKWHGVDGVSYMTECGARYFNNTVHCPNFCSNCGTSFENGGEVLYYYR